MADTVRLATAYTPDNEQVPDGRPHTRNHSPISPDPALAAKITLNHCAGRALAADNFDEVGYYLNPRFSAGECIRTTTELGVLIYEH